MTQSTLSPYYGFYENEIQKKNIKEVPTQKIYVTKYVIEVPTHTTQPIPVPVVLWDL